MKLCTKCNIIKSLEDFPLSKKSPNRESRCIDCKNAHARYTHIARTHGITKEHLLSLLKQQNNKCSICQVEFNHSVRTLKPCIDHCHKTGKLRGIICFQCNVGIGNLKDSPDVLLKAAEYLKNNNLSVNKRGTHLISELSNCNSEKLNDIEGLKKAMEEAALKAKATIINSFFHKFEPQGITGGIILAESHITIHTWPEAKYAAMDFFTCGDTANPYFAQDYMIKYLECKEIEFIEVARMIPHETKFSAHIEKHKTIYE